MKRLTAIIAALVTCACCFACSGGGRYDNVADFAPTQGYRGWTYMFGDAAFQPTLMTYNEYEGCYNSSLTTVCGNEWKPHQNEDVILTFEAPKGGKAAVKVSVGLIGIQTEADGGVLFSVLGDGAKETLTEVSVSGNGKESAASGELTVELKKGERLYFVLNAGYGSENDLTDVRVSVEY